jgi:hypothetical protein
MTHAGRQTTPSARGTSLARAIVATSALIALLGAPPRAGAAPNGPAESSLDKCQDALRREGVKYVQGTQKAIASCLGKVSTEVTKKNTTVAAAVGACTSQFNRIGRTDGLSLESRFEAKVSAKCSPTPANAHSLDDLLGSGVPGVAEPLDVIRLNAYCAAFGGDGSIGSAAEWSACMRAAQDCALRTAIASEFPRALEWLTQVGALMPASPAKTALLATEAAIDGASNDDVPNLTCNFELSSCPGGFPASGQTTKYVAGDDGDLEAGATLGYVDNGNGTLTDLNTGLVWEKKSNDGTLNDKDNCYQWGGVCSGDGTTVCGSDGDCTIAGGTCDAPDCQVATPNGLTIFEWVAQLNLSSFAGHGDWRIPNKKELESLVNIEKLDPAVSTEFNIGCAGSGCTVLNCSCTRSSVYWSSSSYVDGPDATAWAVSFYEGDVILFTKATTTTFVRAVRGGS